MPKYTYLSTYLEGALYWCNLILSDYVETCYHFSDYITKVEHALQIWIQNITLILQCIKNNGKIIQYYIFFPPTGKAVSGSYQVALPDGRVQTVTYTADHYNGYVADVKYEGVPVYPEAKPYHPAPAPKYHPAPKYAPAHA